jgi:D-aminopeptidase
MPRPEKGSIIMILATDAPLDARQLKRLARGRCRAGAHRFGLRPWQRRYRAGLLDRPADRGRCRCLHLALLADHLLDPLFHAAADSVEQAIVHALFAAETVRGRDGHVRVSLRERLA